MSTDNKEIIPKFIALVSQIVERPAMYTVESVEDLSLIIIGYQWTLEGDSNKLLNEFLYGFRVFVNKLFSETENNTVRDLDWARIIRFYSASNSHSLKLFSQYFNEYISDYRQA